MDTSLSLTLEQLQQVNPTNTININIGVLGHIDSGKTSLVRTLSRVSDCLYILDYIHCQFR